MERIKTDQRAQEEEGKRDMDLNLEVNKEEMTHQPLTQTWMQQKTP